MRFLLLALVACTSEPTPSTSTGSGSAPRDLAAMLPKVASAKVLSTKAPNEAYALETWCIDQDATAQITNALERDGWSEVRTIATPQLAIAAIKGDIRFSARASSNLERCAGTYLTATVMRLGAPPP